MYPTIVPNDQTLMCLISVFAETFKVFNTFISVCLVFLPVAICGGPIKSASKYLTWENCARNFHEQKLNEEARVNCVQKKEKKQHVIPG